MVQFNFSERTIKAKVVYYGPAQSGKTTNLEQIHRLTDPAGANRLVSLNTAQDRTLFFDLLPFSLGAVSGYDFKIQLYTVPGQVQYNATRRVVLAGADAVVFVSDSRKSMFKENLSAFENMKVNLLANRLVPEKVPLVLQYNKQDLPDLQTEAEMTKTLNPWGRRAFPATAASGAGVIETFVAVVQEMLTAIAVKYNLKEKGLDPASVPDVVAHAFRSLLTEASTAVPTPAAAKGGSPAKIVLSQPTDMERSGSLPAAPEAGLVSEELLHRAIRSNVELAEALSGLVREMSLGLGSVLSHAELLMVYREDQREKRSSAIHEIQREASRLRKMMDDLGQAGSATVAAAVPRAPAPPPPSSSSVSDATIVPESLDEPIRAAVRAAAGSLAARGLTVDLRLPAGTPTPRCPAQGLQRAVTSLLAGVSRLSPEGSAVILRCERKPVLLRGRDGAEIKRDFLMLAAAHGGGLTPEEQQRILQGSDAGPLGETGRLVRELGGFVRFAPLPGGGLETRLFLPAA
jgi:signal recognition particle receptor subunit beta